MNTAVALILTAFLLVLSVVFLVVLWRRRPASKVDWLVTAVLTAAFVGYVLLAGRFDTSSYYLRPLIALGLLAALVVSLIRVWRAPWWSAPSGTGGWLGFVASLVVAVLFVGLFGSAVSGVSPPAPAVTLSAPLRDGVGYVGQGGASTLLNYHHGNRAQAYAVDIVGLDVVGRNAHGIQPSDPAAYVIFGRPVYSPCAGAVIESRGDLADLRPPATDRVNPAGNHVVVRCQGTEPAVDVTLAHLQQGSVAVGTGAQVIDGQYVGRVGNTGNTTEPHLHVHAVLTGSGTPLRGLGVPMRFDGRFLIRNDLIVGT